jgi:hypothetical protein
MTNRYFDIKLTGVGELHSPIIKLQDIQINVRSNDRGLTWENKNVEVDVDGNLAIFMSCQAISGTDWEFSIQDTVTNKNIYDKKGETGNPQPNSSSITDSIAL